MTETAIALPQALGPLAMLCDGQHTVAEIETKLTVQYGLRLSRLEIENLLQQFDEALILDSHRLTQAKQKALESYRAAPFRPPALAGPSYPADPNALRRLLQSYLDDVGQPSLSASDSRGLISPHIDYQRGGHVYAQVWASAAEAIRQAELVIIFGTDHNGSYGTLTLTPQNYASPLGVMPTDTEVVDRLVKVLGPERAFAEELHHRDEWSIELDLVWLQYLRQEMPCPVVPILCGSFGQYMTGQANIEQEHIFKNFIDVLRKEMSKRRTVVVASGDLAHLGPAFDGPPLDASAHAQMKIDDTALMKNLCQGDSASFLEFMKGQYERNVCGLSPFYFTLELLGHTRGQTIAYDRCLADGNNTSFVSVCGTLFT
ncbi:MAG: AmmeMemoRadiSam system protein B [Anaerolineae bacterium]|nr:AmmeMemoRadiSam system protein B [Anaerolineae bacterium]